MEVYLVDAFSTTPGKGNPAGVMPLTEQLDQQMMLQIAARVGASETAFMQQMAPERWQNRFFTPQTEVSICGHATVGGFFLLAELGLAPVGSALVQATRAGELAVRVTDGEQGKLVWMQLDYPQFVAPDFDLQPALAALGIERTALQRELPLLIAQQNRIFLPLKSVDQLLSLRPDYMDLAAFSRRHGLRGIVPYTLGGRAVDAVTHLRHFAPVAGVNEDPVTGTSNGYLGVMLQRAGVLPAGEHSYIGEQGQALGCAGRVHVSLSPHDVWIGGAACLRGQMSI